MWRLCARPCTVTWWCLHQQSPRTNLARLPREGIPWCGSCLPESDMCIYSIGVALPPRNCVCGPKVREPKFICFNFVFWSMELGKAAVPAYTWQLHTSLMECKKWIEENGASNECLTAVALIPHLHNYDSPKFHMQFCEHICRIIIKQLYYN